MRGRCRVIAIKQCVDLYPDADVVYGCDKPWWVHRKGLPEFAGLKICWAGNGLDAYPDIRRIDIQRLPGPKKQFRDEILTGKTGTVGAGGNSGFQALNLAVQFGARRLILIGFDMTDRGGLHWYGRNSWHGANNPTPSSFDRWLRAFNGAAPVLAGLGVEVVNASPITAMKPFPRRSIADMLEEWR